MNADRTLKDLLASGRDDAVAIAAHEAPPLTYEGLRALIERTCATVNDLGIGLGDRVAIVLPNGAEMATAFLGVASATASAPLNPAYRQDEFEFYLEDLNAKALIIEAGSESPAIDAAERLGVALITLAPEGPAGAFRLLGSEVGAAAEPGLADADDALVGLDFYQQSPAARLHAAGAAIGRIAAIAQRGGADIDDLHSTTPPQSRHAGA